ncbi:hypothetical protein Trydic_g3358 [Trypoxylus dichotomus]
MSYYDYDPNYDFYMYDEPDFDFYFEEPLIPYHLARKKKHRDKRNILFKSDEVDMISYDQLKPKYLVPVFYAPTKVSDPCKFNRHVQENIDLYYSDRRNIEKEARVFNSYAQPYCCASTIQEETESSTCIDTCTLKDDSEDLPKYEPVLINNKRNKDVAEKWQDGNHKAHRIKKKCKATQKITVGASKETKPRIEPFKSDKSGTSNSWTTLVSGSCATNKDTKVTEPTKETNETISVSLSVKKSKSVISFHEKLKPNVKFDVDAKNVLKDVSQNRQGDLQAVKDTGKILSDTEEKMIKQSYENVSNVQSMAIPNNKNTSEVVGWKNTTMQQDSSTSQSSKISCNQELKSIPTIPDISDSTDITINTEEYKDFLKSMNKVNNNHNIPYYYYLPNCNKSMETLSDNSYHTKYKVPANSVDSSDTLIYNKIVYPKQSHEERQLYRRRVNPLVDVPLSISKKTLYSPAFLITEKSKIRDGDGDCYSLSKSGSFVIKVFRRIAGFIGCFQNFAYKYVLRFILFI